MADDPKIEPIPDAVKKPPIDVAVLLATGVLIVLSAAIVGAWIVGDGPLASDLAKNFLGPAFLMIVGYYFGTSRASHAKDETISNLTSNSK